MAEQIVLSKRGKDTDVKQGRAEATAREREPDLAKSRRPNDRMRQIEEAAEEFPGGQQPFARAMTGVLVQ